MWISHISVSQVLLNPVNAMLYLYFLNSKTRTSKLIESSSITGQTQQCTFMAAHHRWEFTHLAWIHRPKPCKVKFRLTFSCGDDNTRQVPSHTNPTRQTVRMSHSLRDGIGNSLHCLHLLSSWRWLSLPHRCWNSKKEETVVPCCNAFFTSLLFNNLRNHKNVCVLPELISANSSNK